MKKTNQELRKYGITMAIALLVVAAIVWWRGKSETAWQVLAGLSGLFLLTGLLVPRMLAPIEWAWMKLAHYMSIVVTHILVTLTFFIVITPVGLMLRLFGKDLLSLKLDKQVQSYWIKVEKDGPASRPDKPY